MINGQNTATRTWIIDIFLIFLLFSIGYGAFLGSYPLYVPDDARYIEVSREMARSGDFVTPRLDGFKFIEKPPLFYWFEATAIDLAGDSLWVGRSMNALFAVLGCLLMYGFGRCFYGRQAGWYAAAILGSSVIYIILARTITIDMTLTFWLSASLLSFLRAYLLAPGKAKRLWCYCAYACAGLAVLSKGLIGIIFPIMIIGLWVVLRWDWKNLRYFYIPTGLLVFLLVALPWHILAQQADSDFFDFYIIGQHFSRYATLAAKRYQPGWFYIVILIAGLLPWTAFLPGAIKYYVQQGWQAWRAQPVNSFLTVWFIFVFVFFSVSNSKLVPYILPIFPALALLLGNYLYQYQQNKKSTATLYYLIFGFTGIFAIACWTSPLWFTEKLMQYKDIIPYIYYMSFIVVVSVAAWGYCWKKGWISRGVGVLAGGMLICLSFGIIFITPITNKKSTKPFADYLENVLTPDDVIITYHNFYFDLPYYLDRLVLVNYDHREIEFGLAQEPDNPQWVTTEEVWQLWNSSQRVFVVTPSKFYSEFKDAAMPGNLLVETSRNVLVSNQSMP